MEPIRERVRRLRQGLAPDFRPIHSASPTASTSSSSAHFTSPPYPHLFTLKESQIDHCSLRVDQIQEEFQRYSELLVKREEEKKREGWADGEMNNLEEMIRQNKRKTEEKERALRALQEQSASREKQSKEVIARLKQQLTQKDRRVELMRKKQGRVLRKVTALRQQVLLLRKELEGIDQWMGKCQEQAGSHQLDQLKAALANMSRTRVQQDMKKEELNKCLLNQLRRDQARLQCQLMKMADLPLLEDPSFEEAAQDFRDKMKSFIRFGTQFAGSRLVTHLEEKEWLLSQVREQNGGGSRMATRLLFKFDPLNSTNFHRYIDQKENLLLVVELQNGYKIGGYCKGALERGKPNMSGKGFLFSLSPNVAYLPKKEARDKQALVTYDDYFLIFGSSELRIKSLELKLFSNFGLQTSLFEARGTKVQEYLGVNGNEVGINHYEIFQIVAE